MTESKKAKILNQVQLQQQIAELAKVNVVTCGNCGDVFYHETHEQEVTCPWCDSEMDVSDCPDLMYKSMENNEY